MFYTYLLKSLKDDELYIGYTNNLKRRFQEHNLGKSKSTKSRKPFKLIYYEAYLSKDDAQKRERNLKLRARASKQLLDRIKESLAS